MKKNYIKPAITLHDFECKPHLMAGSPEYNEGTSPSDENEQIFQVNKRIPSEITSDGIFTSYEKLSNYSKGEMNAWEIHQEQTHENHNYAHFSIKNSIILSEIYCNASIFSIKIDVFSLQSY